MIFYDFQILDPQNILFSTLLINLIIINNEELEEHSKYLILSKFFGSKINCICLTETADLTLYLLIA